MVAELPQSGSVKSPFFDSIIANLSEGLLLSQHHCQPLQKLGSLVTSFLPPVPENMAERFARLASSSARGGISMKKREAT